MITMGQKLLQVATKAKSICLKGFRPGNIRSGSIGTKKCIIMLSLTPGLTLFPKLGLTLDQL
jgi:hypothetical protein